jgi:hypothetical protein
MQFPSGNLVLTIKQNKDYLMHKIIDHGFVNWDIPIYQYAVKGNREKVNFFL